MPSFETLKRWVRDDWSASSKWRKEARLEFGFIAGEQWTAEEKQMMVDQGRVPIVFNRTKTIINAVVGSEINNRTEVRYFPRTLGDAELNETLTKGGEWFRDESGAEEEDSQAFNDCTVAGLGWAETFMDFETNDEGDPKMQRIDPLEMCWDSGASRRGLVDSKRFARVRDVGIDDAREMFPGFDDIELNAKWLDKYRSDGPPDPSVQWSDDDYAHPDSFDSGVEERDKPKKVVLVQLQYCQKIKVVEYINPQTGEKAEMGAKAFGRIRKRFEKMGIEIQSREITRKEWKQVFIGEKILLENQPCSVCSTFTPMTGYWDNLKKTWFGLLRQIKDPQKFANKWLTQTLHIINANSKGGVMVETGAVDDHRDFEDNYANADAVHWMRDGALAAGKVQPKPKVEMPQALMQLTEYAVSSIRDVSGIPREFDGSVDRDQPGILEFQRKQATMMSLATLFDALRQYRKQQGAVLLFFMREYLADGRLIRISDENGERYEPFEITDDNMKFDVIIDDAPSSPNNKERVWAVIERMMPSLEKAGLSAAMWADIIEYSPFPAALIAKFKDYAKEADKPDPEKQKMLELAVEKAMADIEEKKSEAERERANALENIAQGQAAISLAYLRDAQAEAIPHEHERKTWLG